MGDTEIGRHEPRPWELSVASVRRLADGLRRGLEVEGVSTEAYLYLRGCVDALEVCLEASGHVTDDAGQLHLDVSDPAKRLARDVEAWLRRAQSDGGEGE